MKMMIENVSANDNAGTSEAYVKRKSFPSWLGKVKFALLIAGLVLPVFWVIVATSLYFSQTDLSIMLVIPHPIL